MSLGQIFRINFVSTQERYRKVLLTLIFGYMETMSNDIKIGFFIVKGLSRNATSKSAELLKIAGSKSSTYLSFQLRNLLAAVVTLECTPATGLTGKRGPHIRGFL